ncbi:hypothetical protein FD755_016686 [Muntiacus reevesi]|uniref:Snake toxin/toxin-like domain-containing protein n=1 Tax=Muntiacus reevesi TaxID=9886 RepID=A0A5N3XCM2_MUNRE|nr:hypothetical protein FD755_016686 [Muntiacus reevesi]
MKALLLALFAANWALQPGTALQCYSCEDQGNNKGCQCVQNCRTIAGLSTWARAEAIGLLTVTSKGCSSHCVEDARNSFGSKKNACCCANLSNASGAHALQLAGVTPALLATLGHRSLWGRAQL